MKTPEEFLKSKGSILARREMQATCVVMKEYMDYGNRYLIDTVNGYVDKENLIIELKKQIEEQEVELNNLRNIL